ncbi:MAG TPA: 2TM domain-containing protein [Pseudolysinimonas sp.]|nr:2TM domain-containing protein [Pseudolysinimonas sp.]
MSDDLREAARKNLKARNDFKVMLAIFAVVTVIVIAIWALTGARGYFWPAWPILGMSIAAVFAGLDAYGVTRKHITESDIDAEIDRMTRKRSGDSAGSTDDIPPAS